MLAAFHRDEFFGLVLTAFALMGVASLTGCRSGTGADGAPILILRTRRRLARFEFKQPQMGTLFTITLYATDEVQARAAADAAFAKIAALERRMTDYDPRAN